MEVPNKPNVKNLRKQSSKQEQEQEKQPGFASKKTEATPRQAN